MPAYAGTATAEVTPGTISYGMSAAASAARAGEHLTERIEEPVRRREVVRADEHVGDARR